MADVNAQVFIALIAAIGGIITTYLTVRYKDLRAKKSKPEDRMDTIFGGYEKLIKQQQLDIERKTDQLTQTQEIIDRLQEELDKTREIVRLQQDELENSKLVNKNLVAQLEEMKSHYGTNQNRTMVE